MSQHSPLGASSAERWMNCPGSVTLLKSLQLPPSDEPEYRTQGTAAHEMAARCLREGKDAWELVGERSSEVDAEFSVEMGDAVQVYLDIVRPLMVPHAKVYIEQHLSSPRHKLMYGTVDFSTVADSLLNVVDFKYGEGIDVEVEDNPQLKYYAYLVLQDHPDVRRVVTHIVQPRIAWNSEPKRAVYMAEDIVDWVNKELVPAMNAVEMDQSLDAGPWCRFCPAKLVCPLMTSLFGAAVTANPQTTPNLSDMALGRSYQYVPALEMYLKAFKEEVFRRLTAGHDVTGTKLVHKRANRVWKSGSEEALRARFGGALYTAPAMKSPPQVEELGHDAKELVKEYAYTPESGLTVALERDKRPGVKVQSSQEAFGSAAAAMLKDDGHVIQEVEVAFSQEAIDNAEKIS